MSKIARLVLVAVVGVLLVAGAFAAGYLVSRAVLTPPTAAAQTASAGSGSPTNDGAPPEFRQDMPVFWEAWKIINDNFYTQPVDQDKMSYGAVGGMVDALGDIHTAFVDPQRAEYLRQQLQGSFEGIGATVEMANGRLSIIAPIKDSPAAQAGLQAGDVILQVDNTPIQNMDVMQAIALIRGPKGTDVHLKVQRGSQPAFDVTITRNTINVPEVESKMLENDTIAYVSLSEFGDKSTSELHAALQQVLAKNPKALVFDLRGNPGGYLQSAIEIASEFIPENQPVLIEKFRDGKQQVYKTQGGGLATKIPMVLLVNEGSASASEILSASLRDYKRATIVGQKTYGKGSVQTTHDLSDQSELRVTIANFFSPNDVTINHVGVDPDVQVPDPTEYEKAHSIDPQLQKAVDMIKNGDIKPPSNTTSMAQPAPDTIVAALQELAQYLAYLFGTRGTA